MSTVLKLIRPINCLMGIVGVLIGAIVGVGFEVFTERYAFEISIGMFIAFFFMAAGNMLNDYFDRELDLINHPERPIPAGEIQPKYVLYSAAGIFAVLIILGLTINIFMFLILIIATLLMVSYELYLKRRGFVGNITISILVGLLFIFGAAVVAIFGVVIILSILASLATMTREIVKDIEDIKGDVNRITLPKIIGIKNAGIIASISLIIAIILSPIPIFPEILPILEFPSLGYSYIYLILPADFLFIISIYFYTHNPEYASNLLKGGMLLALLAFIIGSIF